MSDIQNDAEIVRERDGKEYEGIDAPLRDQIPTKLLARAEELGLGSKVEQLWHRANADRSNWLQRQQTYLANWDEFLVGDSTGPFQQSSNLHLPMPFIVAKTYHARMLQSLLTNDPIARPRREDVVEKGQVVSDVVRYALSDWSNHNHGVDETLDTWIWDWVTTGVGILKWRWDKQYISFVDVEEETVPGPPEEVVAPDGSIVRRPTSVTREREVRRRKEIFDGPVLEHVRGEDLLLIGGEGDPD